MRDTATASAVAEVRPFRIEVPQQEIDELRRRVAATRWPPRELPAGGMSTIHFSGGVWERLHCVVSRKENS
jgi:hypothetical protein